MQTQVRIPSEQPYRKLWDTYVYFENEQTTSEFLRERYQELGVEKLTPSVYQATPKFIYAIKQAREYYRAAEHCDILTKPLLLYYGMMALGKALITTCDPEYPSTTSVLKHGLSTRKLKREQYSFIEDEVRVQKDGLFNVLHRTLQGPEIENGTRYRMKELLAVIPELIHPYRRLYGEPAVCTLEEVAGSETAGETAEEALLRRAWHLPRAFVAGVEKTKEEFLELLNRHGGERARFSFPEEMDEEGVLRVHLEGEVDHRFPLMLHDFSGQPYLRMPHQGDLVLPEVSVHFMIMFVLGMLCRYETERWGEMILTFSSHDTFLINEFLNVSMRKFPNLILDRLCRERNIFYAP
ncbi:MAG TPA: YaaC family protein [Bacilli bacterium]|nr:YaaC family protein [Bacilli bacterium]